jgi:uncharacterized protein
MLPELQFFYVAVPAVVLVGLSKGGLGSAFGLLGVPILSMIMPPVQAAAIFLPILLVMDVIALWSWRDYNDKKTLLLLLPGGVIGVAIGWATSAYISANAMRVLLAAVTVLFVLRYAIDTFGPRRNQEIPPKPHNTASATFWSGLSGYASFVAHAGGPPFQIYALPLKLDPRSYTGCSVRYFAIINAIKVVPYFALGELGTENLILSAYMLPMALISTLAGAFIVKRLKPEFFYPLMYAMAFITAIKLCWDGLGI